jgi:hypothetical protein
MKKIILLLLVLAFYSCGPSECDCDKHFNKYQSGLGSSQYKLDYNELQDCFKIAEKTGKLTATKGTSEYREQVAKIMSEECNEK